jgi:hypothetical protein
MKEPLDETDLKVLHEIVETWICDDMPLVGIYSYQQVISMLRKLGLNKDADKIQRQSRTFS